MQLITEPTLVLDESICRANIQKMADKARQHNLTFKPHMKTHQSAEIGDWLKDVGVKAITVSSVSMAEYFSRNGWNDITIAFPCNLRQIKQINELAAKTSLTLLVSSPLVAKRLSRDLTEEVQVYVEIDIGANRTGLRSNDITQIKRLIDLFEESPQLKWIGFYSHPGHSYEARSIKKIKEVHQSVLEQLNTLRKTLGPSVGTFEICIGDTPCCSRADDFKHIDAISPGNFVFYDLMQYQIGSCDISDIAVTMKCPIVDKFPDRQELAIYGGAIHFSKESVTINKKQHFGNVVSRNNSELILHEDSYLKNLSQEHGIIKCSKKLMSKYQIGDLISILPVHSCLTANLMGNYQLTDGSIISQMN